MSEVSEFDLELVEDRVDILATLLLPLLIGQRFRVKDDGRVGVIITTDKHGVEIKADDGKTFWTWLEKLERA